jgi:ADP-heptose:LPS heptosyltransferase
MRIGVLKFGGIGDMCDAISFVRAIQKKWGDTAALSLFTDCAPMKPILSQFVTHVFCGSADSWHDTFKKEAYKFQRFYDFRPHVCRVFAGDVYSKKLTLESDKDPAQMRRWKQYNSWETNRLQDIKTDLITLNLKSAELPDVPYETELALKPSPMTGDYITINVGAMGSERGLVQTKQWDFSRWQVVCDELRARYQLPIYHVGRRWEKKLKRVNHLWGLPLLGVAAILKGSRLHLGNENGLIRLRRLVTDKPSVVVFGPTSKIMYGFKNNVNISSGVCRPCFWYTGDWMWECAMGWDKACMTSIKPETVIDAAAEVLDAGDNGHS